MSDPIANLQPEVVWRHFAAISAIPRCSRKEEKVRAYVVECATESKLTVQTDSVGNVVVRRPGSGRGADRPTVVIQGHLDMVCEKNMGTDHDFDHDPIRLVRDGDWLTADSTTLGADNGIAVAMMLALLESAETDLPPIECLFTVDEETGLTGALQLDPALISGRTLINLDTEEEGFFCIGCAGGKNTYGTLPLIWERSGVSDDSASAASGVAIRIVGLRGGHSGVNIHEGRANSVVLGGRLLAGLMRAVPELRVADIRGGDKHNAIPREFEVILRVPTSRFEALEGAVEEAERVFISEVGKREPDLRITIETVEAPRETISGGGAHAIRDLLLALPHGVLGMSDEVEGLVETSTNLAAVGIKDRELSILTSQRSSRGSLIEAAADTVAAVIRLAGGTAHFAEGYPAWPPRADSPLVAAAVAVYRRIAGEEPEVGAFHAGLECGVIGDKVDGMDMISFGPEMSGVHTPDERLSISSTERTWKLLLELLRAL